MKDVLRTLYDFNADVVITGHDHDYERFGPQTVDGVADPARGIRQFVVGTGGRSLTPTLTVRPNSERRYFGGYGVLRSSSIRRGTAGSSFRLRLESASIQAPGAATESVRATRTSWRLSGRRYPRYPHTRLPLPAPASR
jgi:hypothetical protein